MTPPGTGTSSLEIQRLPIDQLTPLPGNPRRGEVDKVANSLAEFGQVKPIVWHKEGKQKVVIAGNHTLLAAQKLGWTEIDTVQFTGTIKAARGYSLADNRTADLGEYDTDDLLAMLEEVADNEAIFAATGYDNDDLQALLDGVATPMAPNPDDVPSVATGVATAKPGQIWQLGPHRIACGSSTEPELVAALMDGERASLVFTDPPYGVSYESQVHGAVANDDKRRDELAEMLTSAFVLQELHAEPEAAWYVWHAMATRADFLYAMQRAGLEEITTIIWTKLSANLGWSDYRPAYEPCLYASRAGERPRFYGDRTNESVWRIAAVGDEGRAATIGPGIVVSDGDGAELMVSTKVPKSQRRHVRTAPGEPVLLIGGDDSTTTAWEVSRETDLVHPTQKPVELVVRAIRNSSRGDEIVLDSFAGSGSTIMGAELTGRRGYGVELDPNIVDVICKRYEQATGTVPRDAVTGKAHSFLEG